MAKKKETAKPMPEEPADSLEYLRRIVPYGVSVIQIGEDVVFRWEFNNQSHESRIRLNEGERWKNRDQALLDGYYAIFFGKYSQVRTGLS